MCRQHETLSRILNVRHRLPLDVLLIAFLLSSSYVRNHDGSDTQWSVTSRIHTSLPGCHRLEACSSTENEDAPQAWTPSTTQRLKR